MTEELLHDAVLIWLLRRLDYSKARQEVFDYFQMLTENDTAEKTSRHDLTIYDKKLPDVFGEFLY